VSRFLRMTVSILAVGVLAAACGDATGPDSGPDPLVLQLTTSFPDDGAVLVALYGTLPATVDVVGGSPDLVIHSVRIADTLRIAVFGTITSGPLLRLRMSDGVDVSQIYGRVEDAASLGNVQRGGVAGYTLRLERN
jgi:hypothetical protein